MARRTYVARRHQRTADVRGRGCAVGGMGTSKTRAMTMKGERSRVPDRLVVSMDERRATVIDIIRNAKRHIALSLFRCNDDAIFAELAAATGRGVAVDVLTTSRAKGGRRKLAKLRKSLDETGAAVTMY